MESTERAISSADRLLVPLNSMCSIKCVIPFSSGDSRREPVPTQTPTDTERTWGITSVMTRTPFVNDVISMSRTVVAEPAELDKARRVPVYFVPFSGMFWLAASAVAELWGRQPQFLLQIDQQQHRPVHEQLRPARLKT